MTVDKWERRTLCDDGACTGVIGQDGTCKVCGRPGADFGDLRKPGRVSSKADEEDEADHAQSTSPTKIAGAATQVSAWNTRTLCPDGACVGVIGADGRCKVCGTAADGAVESADEADEADDDEADEADDDEADDESDDDDEADEADEFDDRQLCPDGACTGVIGYLGRCMVCGKAAK